MATLARRMGFWTPSGATDPVYSRMVLAIVIIGFVAVLSASFPKGEVKKDNPYYYTIRHIAFLVIGVAALYVATRFAPAAHMLLSRWLFLPGLGAMVMCRVSPWAAPHGGNYSWMEIGGLSVQPSEMVKVLYIALLASIMARPVGRKWSNSHVWLQSLLAMGLMCGALFVQQDLGMMFVVIGVTLAMLFLRGLNAVLISGLGVLIFAGGALVTWAMFPTRWERIIMFLDPTRDPRGGGYHLLQMLRTLARGGIGGRGIGLCPEKWSLLPTAHTDSIYCVIGSEVGVAGGIAVLGLVILMATRTFWVSQRAGSASAWFLGSGVGVLLALQSLINIGVATVSMPCTGLTLPFISYGGSSLLSSLFAAGIVLGISRYVPAREAES